MDYDIPKSVEQCREKLREEFLKHKNVTDIRVIDMLVIKVGILFAICILASLIHFAGHVVDLWCLF